MEKIKPEALLIKKILAEQKIVLEKEYVLSNFCLFEKIDFGYLLYNNLTKSLFILSDEEYCFLKELKYFFPKDNIFIQNLIKNWILVSKDLNQIDLVNQVRDFAKLLDYKNYIDSFIILPTTGCNARCFYCYEEGTIPIIMDKATAKSVAKYMINASKGHTIKIIWFGGEPLCNHQAISVISKELKNANVEYKSVIISNSFAFDDEIIKGALEFWNLKSVQVTLDGLEETYNKIKNFKGNNHNPFKKVISNIDKLLKSNIKVTVRMNMDKHNAEELFLLVDFLKEKFGNYEKFSVYCHLLFESMGTNSIERTESERENISHLYFKLKKHIEESSLSCDEEVLPTKIKTNHCMADSKHHNMILPNGKIGLCEHFVENDYIGDIYSDFVSNPWNEYIDPFESCYNCASYPDCILLKKCPDRLHSCFPYEKKEKIDNLKNNMIKYYKDYKEKQ